MDRSFALDKSNAKLMGVCAGLARMTATDPLHVRLAVIVLGLFFAPVIAILYFAAAWLAPAQG